MGGVLACGRFVWERREMKKEEEEAAACRGSFNVQRVVEFVISINLKTRRKEGKKKGRLQKKKADERGIIVGGVSLRSFA
jgi:hypothetical protein